MRVYCILSLKWYLKISRKQMFLTVSEVTSMLYWCCGRECADVLDLAMSPTSGQSINGMLTGRTRLRALGEKPVPISLSLPQIPVLIEP
jgi:hypothetical protein